MNKRIVLALSAVSLFCTLSALDSFALEECSAYKFMHVKTGYGANELWQFHGLSDAGNHEEFKVTADTYNNEFICGILLQSELPLARDPVAVLWSAKEGKLKKSGSSIEKDLWSYHLCGDQECSESACKCGGKPLVDETSCKAYTESGESGAAGAWELIGAEETLKQPYGSTSTEDGDKTLAESETKYLPKYDILCGGDESWHACDKPGCRCIMDYACTEDNEWVLCPAGCIEVDGKAVCKETEAVKDCEENVVAEGSTIVPGNKEELCSIDKATLTGVSGEKATVSIEYLAGSGKSQKTVILDCSSKGERTVVETEERDEGEPKTCYIECFPTFVGGDGKRMAELNLCYEIPEPQRQEPVKVKTEPKKFTPPVEEVQEPEPKPERAEFKEPETKCEEYYGIIRIEGEDTEKPKVDDPCGFLKTLEVDRSAQCKKVGGDLDKKYYDLIDIPPCTPSIKDFFEVGGDIFVNIFGEEDEEVPEGECGGKIRDISHHLEGDEIEISLSFTNTGEETCIYQPCILGVNKETGETTDEKECGEWITLKPWELGASTISSEGTNIRAFLKKFLTGKTEELNIEDITSWDVEGLGGKYKVRLTAKKASGGAEKEVDSEESPVCNDEALIVCTTPDMKYGILDSSKYVTLAREQIDDNIDRFWVLNVESFHLMDVEECVDKGDGSSENEVAGEDASEIKFYTIADFDKYRKYVDESFSKESGYIKYTDMFFQDLADYIYCYKTDIRNTSVCSEINLEWYAVSKDRTQRYIDEDYLDDVRRWNKNQNVTELTPIDKGEPDIKPNYEALYCAVSMDQDFYKLGDTITITYTNAPKRSTLNLYRWNKDEGMWEWTGGSWTVENSGTETYKIRADEKTDCFRASLYSGNGECRPVDDAKIGVTALRSVMSQAFMLTPLLEDTRNDMLWTETGKGILYAGSGFDRYDACELSCDAKDTECRLHPDCDKALGSYPGECDDCINKGDCTRDSRGICGGEKGDCWDRVCRVESSFVLEADVGGESFHGIPYKGDCPEGFTKKQVTTYNHEWFIPLAESPAKTETKCVLEGGVIGKTYLEFPAPKSSGPKVDMVFVIDTSITMREEWTQLCGIIKDRVIEKIGNKNIELDYTIYGLSTDPAYSGNCVDHEIDTKALIGTGKKDNIYREAWVKGIVWASENHPWRDESKRIIIPISDTDVENKDVNPAIAAATAGDITVYALYGETDEGDSPQDEMRTLAEATGGKAMPFDNPEVIVDFLVGAASTGDANPAVLNNAEVKFEKVKGRDNVWELWQEEEQEVIYSAEGVRLETEEESSFTFTLKPSLHVTETGNMPFEILYTTLSKEEGGRYVLTRLYKPEDPDRKLIISSDIDLNYTLLETASQLRVEVNSTYATSVRRDKYYTACNFVSCAQTGGGMGKKFVYSGCGALSTVEEGYSRREVITEYVDSVESEKDVINVEGVSHSDVLCNTLDELTIEGTIEEYIDGEGEVVLASSLDDPVTITISPDILGGFVFRVGRSFIVYNSLFYPTKHHLYKKQGFSYPDVLWYGFDDRYGFEDEAYGFLQQCRKICPPFPVCRAEDGKPLEPECVEIQEDAMEWAAREDCVYPPMGCYEDPCISKRTYHEEEGSFIANGDFESMDDGEPTYWNIVSGSAEQKFSGYSGYMLELNGEIEQDIPSLHTAPFHQLCLEYALKEDKAGGSFDVILSTEEDDEELSVWKSEPDEECILGWQKKCFPVQANDITKIRLKSDFTVWVDNVNLGSYYDYVDLYTYDSSLIEYMDQNMKGWDEVGLLHTGGVTHEDNTYTFELMSYPVMKIDFEKGMTTGSLTVENVKEGDITIQTFFQDILIPLAENTGGIDEGTEETGEETATAGRVVFDTSFYRFLDYAFCNKPDNTDNQYILNIAKWLGGKRILFYISYDEACNRALDTLRSNGYEVDFKSKESVGEILDYSGYDQVWLFRNPLTEGEKEALKEFQESGGGLMLSADDVGQEEANGISSTFGVTFYGNMRTGSGESHCIAPTIEINGETHQVWQDITRVTTSNTDSYLRINNPEIEVTAKFGDEPYGAVLDHQGIAVDEEEEPEERTGPCYTLNLTFRRATDLTLELNPSSHALAPGTEVTVTATLVYHADKTPVEGQRVYFDLSGKDIWKHSPTGLYRDYMFKTGELSGSEEQQANLRDYLKAFKDDELLKEFDEGTYSIDVEEENAYFVTSAGEKIIMGSVGENGEVYETEEQRTLAYAVTNSEGVATFTYVPSGSVLNANAPGQAGSASSASAGVHVVEIKSPLFSGEFLLLVVILVFAVFSYRYFKDRKFDLYSWWKDYKGRK